MYIFDLEGTLSDCRHRLHLLPSDEQRKANLEKRHDLYMPFADAFIIDKPIAPMVELANHLADFNTIVILTGRMEKHRESTVDWLNRNSVPHDILIMRADDDFRLSEHYKYDWISKQSKKVKMVFDDRQKIIDFLNSKGIPSLLVNL